MREQALTIFNAAVSAVQPASLLPKNISLKNGVLSLCDQKFSLQHWHHVYVIGAGKASAAMALETEKILGPHIHKGIVVTKYGHALRLQKIKCLEAGHPVPDKNSIQAGKDILELVQNANEKDMIIFLVSGGASSLMTDLPPGITLRQMQEVFTALLESGATINEMNTVRKHLSLIKGGQLAKAAYPATIISLILSDVVGDPLDVIASGPAVPDPTSFEDANNVIEKYSLATKIHPAITERIKKGLKGEINDTPKPGDKIFQNVSNHLIGTNRIALEAASGKAMQLGFTPIVLTDKLQGEAREQAKAFVEDIFETNDDKPVCLLMGGETTVTIKGKGKGGRNQEFVLAALLELIKKKNEGVAKNILILSAGTDGTDGPTEVAGAIVDAITVEKVKELKLDIASYLDDNDSFHFFEKVGGHVVTGPTQTNVMDLVIALLY